MKSQETRQTGEDKSKSSILELNYFSVSFGQYKQKNSCDCKTSCQRINKIRWKTFLMEKVFVKLCKFFEQFQVHFFAFSCNKIVCNLNIECNLIALLFSWIKFLRLCIRIQRFDSNVPRRIVTTVVIFRREIESFFFFG